MMESLTKLDQEVERTLTIARTRFPSHSFPDPKVKMDLTGKSAGVFYPGKQPLLKFNLSLLLNNKEDFIQETVPHEVAHYVVEVIDPNSKPHGLTWRSIMRLFGIANPQVYHNYEVSNSVRHKRPYIYECPCQRHYFTKRRHNNVRKGTEYICNVCKRSCRYIGKKED